MIDLVHTKRVLAIALAAVGLAAGLFGLRAAAESVLRSASGADPASVFNEIPPAPAELMDTVHWLPDPPRDGRPMEPATRRAITDAYARALAALDRAGRGDPAAPLAGYLGGPALDAALDAARAADRVETATIHLRHDLELEFYSDDGSIVAVGAPSVEVVRVLDGAAGRTVVASDEAWRFAMLLEDGNWRIQQLEAVALDDGAVAPRRPLVRNVHGVNVVTASGTDRTWHSFEASVAIADLDAARALGYDAVRVFVAGPEFGTVDVDALTEFLDLAAERELGVVPVLFDGSADHRPIRWRDDRAYLAHVVGAVAGHPAIVMWDLKNEPDLDDDRSGGAPFVDAWLRRTAGDVRMLDAGVPVTIGWSGAADAVRVLDAVDVVSFHHFGDARTLAAAIDRLDGAIGDRPLVVSEFGRPEWSGLVRGTMPAAQAQAVAELIEAADAADGSMLWVLRDPAEPIESGFVAGRASTSYGLLRHDGSERPVAEVVREGAVAVPAASVGESVRGALPLAAVVLVLGAAVVAAALALRRRRPAEGAGHA